MNANSIKVSVLMPVYNTKEEYLRESIESVINQTFQNFELLIGDDGSDNDIKSVVNSFDDDRIKYFKFPHCGVARTRNNLLNLASGEYAAWLDSDDIALEDRLESQVNFLEENPDISLCGGYLEYFNCDCKDKIKRCSLKLGYLEYNQIAQTTLMFRLSDINKYNLRYNEDFKTFEDPEFYLRVFKILKGANLDKVLTKYRFLEDSLSHNKKNNGIATVFALELNTRFYNFLTSDLKKQIKISEILSPLTFKEKLFSFKNKYFMGNKYKYIHILGFKFIFKVKQNKGLNECEK